MTEVRKVSEIVYRTDLYPRINHDPALVQRYAGNLEMLPAIEVNQHNELIDGWHRWTAHRKAEAETINVKVTPTKSETEFLKLAIERNSNHGKQLEETDKKSMAIRLYNAGAGETKEEIARVLSVTVRSVTGYLSDIEKQLREERKQKIFDMWMACNTLEEIADAVGVTHPTIKTETDTFVDSGNTSTFYKSLDFTRDNDFAPPLYNLWTFAKKTNNVSHFGNSEQRIVDNLLYLYTEPFDIVVDPFGGGGSTIDACKYRLRRYWVSDRKPIPEREKEIRKHDLMVDGLPPLNRNWSNVTLTYLDPPYWRQAAGMYSSDPTDLANMPLEDFTKAMVDLVKGVASKQSKGVIALIIQPTQWKSDGKQFADHVLDIVAGVGNKKLVLENRVSCPYSTEQYNAQQVTWAKENKMWSTESYSDRTNPVEKFRQRYAEHDHDDVFFIAGGYMALARWFPIRTQMHLLAPQETVTIEGNCIVSFDAGYETAMREPHMINKFGKNKQDWYERRRHGMLVEHHVANYFRRHYPQYFREPTNKGNYEKPAKEDFILQTEWNKIIVDVKSIGDFRQGECDTFVVTDPNEVGIYIVADFCERTNRVTMIGMTTGDIVKLLGEKSTRRDDLYFVATNHLWSVEPLLVMLNMADCDMEYTEYKRNIKRVELAKQAA